LNLIFIFLILSLLSHRRGNICDDETCISIATASKIHFAINLRFSQHLLVEDQFFNPDVYFEFPELTVLTRSL
jgi:hypothetical protein